MTDSLARNIIRNALRVREQDRLWIHTWGHSFEFAEEIAKEAYSHGTPTVISVMSEGLANHTLKKSPPELLTTSPDHMFQGVIKSTALVVLAGPEDPTILRSADPSKALVFTGHEVRLLGTAVTRRVRVLKVHITSFTAEAGKVYGFNHTKLREASNKWLTANQSQMMELGKQITELLQKHKSIHISSSEGSNLNFRVQGSHAMIDDGIIDQDDLRRKTTYAQLPGGTVSVPIDGTSAEGTVIFKWPRAFLGKIVQDLRLDFKKGKITNYRALKGEEVFTKALKAASGSADRLTRLRVGINPNATEAFTQPTDALIPGTITLGLGDNTFIGGNNQSNFAYEHTLDNAIVSIGPTAVIMDGKLSL